MAATRLSTATWDRLRTSGLPGKTADELINALLDELERRRFWDQYATAARHDVATLEQQAEHEAWEQTLSDGLA
jgi:hypothetical protein